MCRLKARIKPIITVIDLSSSHGSRGNAIGAAISGTDAINIYSSAYTYPLKIAIHTVVSFPSVSL